MVVWSPPPPISWFLFFEGQYPRNSKLVSGIVESVELKQRIWRNFAPTGYRRGISFS